jgi:excisionase family DNA binding protein
MTTTVKAPVGVSIREAATALGLSPNAVRMRIRHKTLPAFKDGEHWRVLLDGSAPETGWSPMSDHRLRPTSIETDPPRSLW